MDEGELACLFEALRVCDAAAVGDVAAVEQDVHAHALRAALEAAPND